MLIAIVNIIIIGIVIIITLHHYYDYCLKMHPNI